MPTAKISVLNLILNRQFLILPAVLLFAASNISHADNISATNNTPAPENQVTSVQEILTEETPVANARGKVARAIFTSEIIDREPANDLTEISNTTDRIYFFTDLRNLTGQIITHQWEYNDKVMAKVKFKVGGGPRWRVYSSKNFLPEWTGVWTVIVTDENEQTLETSVFNYTQAIKSPESPTAPELQVSE